MAIECEPTGAIFALRKLWFIPLAIAAGLLAVWLLRARLAGEIAESYFREHGVQSTVHVSRLGLSGVAGSIALGPADAPEFSAQAVEADFDPLSLMPRLVAVRLIHPVIRVRLDEKGGVALPSLQSWINSLSAGKGQSRYVGDDLAISLSDLRVLLATPAGMAELDGDVELKRSALVSAALTAKSAMLAWRGFSVSLGGAGVKLDAVPDGYRVVAHVEASVKGMGFEASGLAAQVSAPLIRPDFKAGAFVMPALDIKATADKVAGSSLVAAKPTLAFHADDAHGSLSGDAGARITLAAGADFSPGVLPLLARDRALSGALQSNLRHLDLAMKADIARQKDEWRISLTGPADIRGARGGALRLASLAFAGTPSFLSGRFDAALSGPNLPRISLSARDVSWRNGVLVSNADLSARFDFDMLHGVEITANGAARLQNGVFSFRLGSCAPVALAAFHPGASDLAQGIRGEICPVPGTDTLSTGVSGWKFAGQAKDVAMFVPLGNVAVEGGAGRVAFAGKAMDVSGKMEVTAALMNDRTKPRRFEPMTGTGEVQLDKWIWSGQFQVAGGKNSLLGTASFHHATESGAGELKLNATRLEFAQGKLQPIMLSPLLGSVTRAEGTARFDGDVTWTRDRIDSHGDLTIEQLDFLTPLGTAHAVNAKIALSSLLPPATAPGQHLTISRVDWALPLSGIALDFSYGGGTLKLDSLSGGISEGNMRLGALSIDLSGGRKVEGTASLSAISLAPLIAASNLAGKIKLDGKVTGSVPFSFGPEGFRITNGHVAALGSGHLSLDRSVWEAGGATAANAVQDLAYQALESLAFDQLSADINSIPGGRLQVVFHLKGHSDPPKPQQAEVAVADILNGSALQKPIPLPSNTPIDLTLDTSLNFDELLNSYKEAWSKTLGQAGLSN
jgi:hypothetical protein